MLEFDEIRRVLELAKQHGFREVEADVSGISFSATLEKVAVNPKLGSIIAIEEGDPSVSDDLMVEVCAPCVGYFRHTKTPVQIGQPISDGEVVATIFALGLSNDVEVKIGGEVLDVLAKHEQPVEFGQPLFRIKVNS